MAKHRKAAAPATTTQAAPAADVVQDQGAAGDTGAVESTDATATDAAQADGVAQDQGVTGDAGVVESTAAAPATTTQAAPAADVVQDQGAAGDTGAVESTDGATPEPAAEPSAASFPREVTIRNHGALAVCEPSTRAYVGAGGSCSAVIHSAEQATLFMSNIKSMHGGDKVQVIGLDDVALGDDDGGAE